MALSDCPNCWQTPCICGEQYKDLTEEQAFVLIDAILSGQKKPLKILDNLILKHKD